MKFKKLIIIILGLLAVLFVLYLVYSFNSEKSDESINIDNPRGVTEIDEYFEYVTADNIKIRMKNFIDQPLRVVEESGVYIAETDQYGIFYDIYNKIFLISILEQPIEETRVLAEQQFLKILDIANTDACRLNVSLTGHISVDERFGNSPNFGLSFCPNGVRFPDGESNEDQIINIR